MRGDRERQANIMLAVTPEAFVPDDHTLWRTCFRRDHLLGREQVRANSDGADKQDCGDERRLCRRGHSSPRAHPETGSATSSRGHQGSLLAPWANSSATNTPRTQTFLSRSASPGRATNASGGGVQDWSCCLANSTQSNCRGGGWPSAACSSSSSPAHLPQGFRCTTHGLSPSAEGVSTLNELVHIPVEERSLNLTDAPQIERYSR